MGKGDTIINAVLGAVVTVVFSFTGVSPVLGGGVAGYLQRESRESGAKVGALSGAFAFIPAVLFIFVFSGFFLMGPMMGGGFAGGFMLLLVVPFFLAWNVGLGALGGYLAVYLREEMDSGSR